jgi:hypothetical protein
MLTSPGASARRSSVSPERARSLGWLALSDDAAALTGEYIVEEKVVSPSAQAVRVVAASLAIGGYGRTVRNRGESPGFG